MNAYPERGQLHVTLDAALASLELPEDELRIFCARLGQTIKRETHHSYLTMRHNALVKERQSKGGLSYLEALAAPLAKE